LPISLSSQMYIFLCSIIGGILIAFIYDAFRIKRKAVKTSTIIIYIEDLIFWIIVAFIMFAVIYFSNEGEVRGYIFIGSILGIILYTLIFSKIVMTAALFILRIIYKVLKAIWIVASYPFKIILRLLLFPARFVVGILGKCFRGIKRTGKNKLTKISMRGRFLRNIRKKI
jgi:spore cortex biosynthesis protein YabQ